MKEADMKRALVLIEAYRGLKNLTKAMAIEGKPPPVDGDYYCAVVSVEARCEGGGSGVEEIELDLTTGAKFLPFLQNVIGDELAALGVEPPEDDFEEKT